MKESISVSSLKREVTYSGFRLSIAHFTTEEGRLGLISGHNLEVEITLSLETNFFFPDLFEWLDKKLKFMDHRTLIAQNQENITVKLIENKNFEIKWLDFSISVPKDEICLLPIQNTHPITLLEFIGYKILNEWEFEKLPLKIAITANDLPYRQYKIELMTNETI